jgi:mRNA interferase MazF
LIRRGEIYLANFGQTKGNEQAGIRPVIVIQSDLGNENSNSTIVAALSTRRFAAEYPFHVHLAPKQSGLREASTVLLEQIQTMFQERLGQRIGHATPDAMQEVDRALHVSLGLLD